MKVVAERDVYLANPQFLVQGYWGMFAHLAIFMTDVDSTETFGLSYGISDCDAECYNPVTREKVWGTTTATLLWDNIKIIFTKRLDKYRYKVMSSTGKTILESSSPITGKAFEGISTKDISVFNLRWKLIVEPVDPLEPSWRDPAIAVTVILTGVLALLVQSVMLQKIEKRLLLLDILPKYALDALQKGQDARRQFDGAAMLFTDIVDFTELSSRTPPSEMAKFLDELYTMFDLISAKHNVYKIETIGDAFVCCTGCPYPTTPESDAVNIALMAIDLVDAVKVFTSSSGIKIQIRIGLHFGPVIGTIMGRKCPRFCLVGDTVNTTSRMESNSLPMRIHCSKAIASLLQASGVFQLDCRGIIDVKGKGPMETYWVSANFKAATAVTVVSAVECDHITIGGGFEKVSTVES